MKAAALLLLLVSLCAQAAIYRWVDSHGVVHFAQSPPETGRAVQRIDPQVPPPTAAPAVKAIDQTTARFSAQQAQRQQAHEKELAGKARRAEDCAKARSRISMLEEKTAHRLFVKGANGQLARMTQEQFERRLQQARAAAAASCGQ